MDNEKLVGTLRLNLEMLRKDASSANDIINNLSNMKIDSINVGDGKDAIKTLRLIEDELKNVKKATGDSFSTDITGVLENQIKQLGVTLDQTLIKTTESVRKNKNDQVTSIKTLIETMDELGKKSAQVETTRISYDKKGNESNRSTSVVDVTTTEAAKIKVQEYTKEIANLSAEYNTLSRTGKLTTENITDIITQLGKVTEDYDLNGVALAKVTKLQDTYNKKVLELQNPGVSPTKVNDYNNSAQSKLDAIKTIYNNSTSTGQARIDELSGDTGLIAQVEKITKDYDLKGAALVRVTAQTKSYRDEADRITESLKKEADAQSKNNGTVDFTGYKKELSNLSKEYNSLDESKDSARATSLTNLATKTRELSISLGLTGEAYNKAEAQAKKYETEANNITKALSKSSNDNPASKELTAIATAYQKLELEGKTTTQSLTGMANEVQKVTDKYNLQGDALKKAQSQQLSYTNESTKLAETQSNNAFKNSLLEIKNAYTELNISGKATSENYQELKDKTVALENTDKISIEQKQQLLTLDKQMTSGITKLNEAKDKQIATSEKQSLAELKLFTQETAQSSQYDKMSKTLANISGEQNLAMSSSNAGSSIGDRFKVSGIYAAAAASIYAVKQSFTDAIETNKNYELGLQDLGRILGNLTNNDMKAFGAEAIQISKDFGTPLQQVQDAMSSLASAGVQDKASLSSMTNTVMTGLNTSDIKDASTMTQLLTSSMKQLGISYSDSEKVLDSWNASADKHISKTSDYAQAVSKAGLTSKIMGIDLNELNGIVSVLGDNTGKTGDEIGDSLKSVETRLEKPSTLKTLKQYGIEVMADATHFKSFGEIVTNISTALDKFGENTTQSNDILNAVGGTMRKDDFAVLAQNYSKVSIAAKESADSQGYSATKNAAIMDTLAKKVEVFNNTVKQFYIGLGNNGLSTQLKGIVDIGTSLMEANSKYAGFLLTLGEVTLAVKGVSEAMKILKGQNLKQWLDKNLDFSKLDQLTNFKIPLLSQFNGQTTSVNAYEAAVNSLTKQVSAGNITGKQSAAILEIIRDKAGLAKTSTNTLEAAENALKDTEFASTTKGKELAASMEGLKAAQAGAGITAKDQKASEEALSAMQKETAASANALRVAEIGITLGITILITALTSAYEWYSKADERQQEAIQNGADAAKKYQDEAKSIQDLVTQYQQLSSSGKTDSDTKKQLLDIQTQLITSYGNEGKSIDLVNGKYDEQIKKIQSLNKEKAEEYIRTNQVNADNADETLNSVKTFSVSDSFSDFTNQAARVKQILSSINGVKIDEGNGINGVYEITGNLEKRVSILKEILDKTDSITNKNSQEDTMVKKISDEYGKLNKELANAKSTTEQMYTAKLTEKYSDNMNKLNVDVMTYQNALNSNDSAGAQKAQKDFNDLAYSMEKTLSKNPEMKTAFEDWINNLNMTGDSAKGSTPSVLTFASAMSNVTKVMSTAKTNISEVNSIIDKHTKSNEWDEDSIIKLSATYPDLLKCLGNDKAMTDELNDIKKKETNTVTDSLQTQINAEVDTINSLGKAYGTDVSNFVNKEQEKTNALKEAIQARITEYGSELSAIDVTNDAFKSIEPNVKVPSLFNITAKAEENSTDGLRAKLNQAKSDLDALNTTVSSYDALKATSGTIDKYLGNAGDSENNGETDKNSKEAKQDQISTIANAKTYASVITQQNDLLKIQDNTIEDINSKISQQESAKDYTAEIQSQNQLLDAQKQKLSMLQNTSSVYSSTKDSLKQAFQSNGWFSDVSSTDMNALTKTNFDSIYDSMFAGTKDFGNGDDAEAAKKQWEDSANTFKTLADQYIQLDEAVTTNDKAVITLKSDIQKTLESIDKTKISNITAGYDTDISNAEKVTKEFEYASKSIKSTDYASEISNAKAKVETLDKEIVSVTNDTYKYAQINAATTEGQKEANDAYATGVSKIEDLKSSAIDAAKALEDYNIASEESQLTTKNTATDKSLKSIQYAAKSIDSTDYAGQIANDEKQVSAYQQKVEDTTNTMTGYMNTATTTAEGQVELDNKFKDGVTAVDGYNDSILELLLSEEKAALESQKANALLQDQYDAYGGLTQEAYDTQNENAQTAIQTEIDNLTKAADLQTEIETRLKNQNDLIEKQTALQTAQNNKSTKLDVQNADGTWGVKYVADATTVEVAQKAVQDQITSNDEWEESTALKHTEATLTAEKQALADAKTAADKAYSTSETATNKYYADIDAMASRNLAVLVSTYGTNYGKIQSVISTTAASAVTDIDKVIAAQERLNAVVAGGIATSSSGSTSTTTATTSWNNTVTAADGTISGSITGSDGYVYTFADGGETNATGLHWLDGMNNKPERVLTSTQTEDFGELVTYLPTTLTSMNDIMDKINSTNISNNSKGDTYISNTYGDLSFPDVTSSDEILAAINSLSSAVKQKSS